MKKILLLAIFGMSLNLFSQADRDTTVILQEKRCLTAGILQGGGSLIGLDIEVLLNKYIGIQAGAGLVGFGAGINYHLKPGVRSSFISCQYWNQGIGDSFVQNAISVNYVYRSRKWFSGQIGLGAPLDLGPGAPDDFEQPNVMLTYSLGAYFPW